MEDKSTVPAWLLSELLLTHGVFNEDRTAVIGRPNAHLSAVLNEGRGAPATTTVYLNKFPEALKRLADEGY